MHLVTLIHGPGDGIDFVTHWGGHIILETQCGRIAGYRRETPRRAVFVSYELSAEKALQACTEASIREAE